MEPDSSDVFGGPDHVRDLFEADVRRVKAPSVGSDLTQLGSDGGGNFVVGADRVVWWLATEPGIASRFVNSTFFAVWRVPVDRRALARRLDGDD